MAWLAARSLTQLPAFYRSIKRFSMVQPYHFNRCVFFLLWVFCQGSLAQAQSLPAPGCISDNSLQIWLPLEQTSGNQAQDASGANHPGTVTGGVWQQTATTRPHSLLLAGTDNLFVPLVCQPTAFTVAFWVRPTKLTDNNCLVSARLANWPGQPWGGFAFHTTVNGDVSAGTEGYNNGRVMGQGAMQARIWQHFVFTYANGTGTLYKNGTLLGSAPMAAPQPWEGLMVGAGNLASYLDFGGSIADLRLYFRALSATEANDLAQCPAAALPPPASGPLPALQTSPNPTITPGRTTTLQAQARQSALRFDGVADQVAVAPPVGTAPAPALLANVVNTFTVEAWVYPTAPHEIDPQKTDGVDGVFHQRYLIFPEHGGDWGTGHAGMGLSVGTNGVSVYEHAAGYLPALLVWQGALTGWTHVAVVYQDGRPSLYVNGQWKADGEESHMAYVHPSTSFGGGYYGYFQGQADELRIWNEARTAGQIQALYRQAVTTPAATLLGRWPLDDGSGLTTADASGQQLTGTLTRGSTADPYQNYILIAPSPGPGPQWQAASIAPVADGLTYTWSPATGLSTTSGASVVAHPAATTIYTVSATAGGGPVAQAVVTVTVNAQANVPPNAPADDLSRNWTLERTYDGSGNSAADVLAESKHFTDGLGRATQSQARSRANPHVFASETLYSSAGQPVVQTLAAPINNQGFAYKEQFSAVTRTAPDGTVSTVNYDPANFEGAKAASPDGLDVRQPGTLGYYYSTENQLEPLTPATAYPFGLTEPADGPLGGLNRAAAPGETFRMGAGHEARSREIPLLNEFDHYLALRHHFVSGSATPTTLQHQGTKSVSVDGDGRERVVVTNKEGQALVSCLTNAQYPPLAVSGGISTDPANAANESAPRFQDIHIPATGEHRLDFTLGGTVRIRNLNGGPSVSATIGSGYADSIDVVVSSSPGAVTSAYLLPGFYRLASLPGTTAAEQTQRFDYVAEYGNFSYTYYDDAGRVVATVAPNGLRDVAALGNALPGFVTRNTYDASSRLLSTESPDEGRSEYVYARDGRIRFSQSALQRPTGRFSYSNYDEVGRVAESGEYTPAAVPAPNASLSDQLTAAAQQPFQSARLEAETAETNAIAYAGCCVGYISQVGSYVQFTVQVPQDGTYDLNCSYSSGTPGPDRRMSLLANGSLVGPALFANTDNYQWATYAIKTMTAFLHAGTNLVRLEYGPTDNGEINLDYLQVVAQPGAATALADLVEERLPTNSLDAARGAQRNLVWYDLPWDGTPNSQGRDSPLAGRTQAFTVGAVTKTQNDNVTTWYSYDEQGRVTWVVQDIAGLGVKTLDYTYDVAGNVLEVAYQHGQPDAFHHYYEYDQAQRLQTVYTSPDGAVRTQQAEYFYYLHGPLKRVELANRLQGVDYTYTLQGWLKGINHVNGRLDPGGDSPAGSGLPKDLFGLTLDYFSGDYQSRAQAAGNLAGPGTPASPFRYDGTIRTASWRTAGSPAPHQSVYAYDAKSQLAQSNFGALTIAGTPTAPTYLATPSLAYQEGGLSYDPNGNLQGLRRTDKDGTATDNFSYEYTAGTNRLSAVHGGGSATGAAVMDYDYDALGQLTRQRDEQGQRYLTYDVTGKTTGLYQDAAHQQPIVEFAYDDKGFRVSKKSYGTGESTRQVRTTYYVRDASGNVLSVYEQGPQTGTAVQRSEVPLYGASRVGVLTHLDDGTTAGTDDARYELNDQLGDARVVFHRPTTLVTTASVELSLAASQEDGQWPGLAQAHRYSSVAHQGVTTPSTYVAFVAPPTAGGRSEGPHRTVAVEKGDTLTFSAWAYLEAADNTIGKGSSARLHALPTLTPASAQEPGKAAADNIPSPMSRQGWLSRFTAGIALVGWGGKSPMALAAARGTGADVWLRYRVFDEAGNLVTEQYEYQSNANAQTWQQLQTAMRVQQAGSVEVAIGSDDPNWKVSFDDLRLEQTGGMIVQEQHQYAYGSPLVGLNYAVGNKLYRYGYQGQYAEKDAETGFESFELRLYNSRIGRWSIDDPAGQFHSPYIGMGNNPISNKDHNGALSSTAIGGLIGIALGGTVGGIMGYDRGGTSGMLFGALAGGAVGGFIGSLAGNGLSDVKFPQNTPWVDMVKPLAINTVTQDKPLWCLYATAQAINNFFGGNKSQWDYAKADNNGVPANREVTNMPGWYDKNFIKPGYNMYAPPTPEIISQILAAGHPITVGLTNYTYQEGPNTKIRNVGHNVVIKGIQEKIMANGHHRYRLLVVDPDAEGLVGPMPLYERLFDKKFSIAFPILGIK